MKGNQDMIKKISYDIKNSVENAIKSNPIDKKVLYKIIINHLAAKIHEITLRNPIIIPIILTL